MGLQKCKKKNQKTKKPERCLISKFVNWNRILIFK